jgi:hypothetical protein
MRDRREEIGRLADRILRNNLSFSEMEAQVAPDDADFLRLDAEQNAVRCLRIRDIVHRCHASKSRSPEQPLSVLETGIGYGYVTTCLRESFGDSIAMYALEHPGREYIKRPAFQDYLLRGTDSRSTPSFSPRSWSTSRRPPLPISFAASPGASPLTAVWS